MKKKTYVLGVAVLFTALLAMSGVAQSAMWVGVELGGNFAVINKTEVNGFDRGGATPKPAVIGGATIGYDFINSGFGAYNWPDWMKYFSVATDITYNRLNITGHTEGLGDFPLFLRSKLDGSIVTWTFMLIAHYGFFPDSEVPTGRVIPYIGVGPAILWSSINSLETRIGHFDGGTATNVALVVEPGIRWMALPNVSIDTAIRYRHAVPTWEAGNTSIKANSLNMFAFLVRANYHF